MRQEIAASSTTVRDYERTHIVEILRTRILAIISDRLNIDPDMDYRAPLLTSLFIELLVSAKRWINSAVTC